MTNIYRVEGGAKILHTHVVGVKKKSGMLRSTKYSYLFRAFLHLEPNNNLEACRPSYVHLQSTHGR